ncbi:MAG: hypothetical protein R3F62_28290 [Planctomycetota bacterium]
MTDASPPAPARAQASRWRVALYLVLGALGVVWALVFLPKGPSDDVADLLERVRAAPDPAGLFEVRESAASVYNHGAGYVLTVRIDDDAEIGRDGHLVIERVLQRPLAGQFLYDSGEGQALESAELDALVERLGIDLAPWDALCAAPDEVRASIRRAQSSAPTGK